jgi:hypothetical protein
MQAAPWAVGEVSVLFVATMVLRDCLPASSWTMALPIACVAPVTMHTKPYCRESAHLHYAANWRSGHTSLPSALYGEKC